MRSLLDKFLGKDNKTAKTTARDRLQVVIMHDRAALPAPLLEQMRRDIMAVVSRYVEVDEDALDVNLERDEETVALVANIPIRRVKDKRDVD